ncbi:DNA-binding domain-containing protein [Caulobacter soli]|uniref:HvfC/BufC N-terminal domain-containing protein n=1 Tax=Caulobacter soli TaxID=2708539 RepID=UPI0013EC20C2|nr:DNA-binding domain-containing protein [Caulobacter soli]
MSELGRFQDAFVTALAGRTAAPITAWLPDDADQPPGLAVYRNTIAKGCVDALAANFPTVASLVGDDWFRAAAALFAAEHPPASAALAAYGEAFPDWLSRFPPADDLPYLPAMAQMDRLWTTALFAPEAEPLAAEAFALAPDVLAAARPRLHPSLAFAGFDSGLPGLWLAAREPEPGEMVLADDPQGVLIVRPHDTVRSRLLDRAGFAFLTAARDGASLGAAITAAAETDPAADLAALFAALIADGVFSGLDLGDPT